MVKRAMTSQKASYVKRQGHKDALEFALLLGLKKDYQNDPKAKKDVIDNSGYSYSVKSGQKKWQIFLYSLSRFKNDILFQSLNGLGDLFINCINVFPENIKEYKNNKPFYKKKLAQEMVKIKEYLLTPKKLKGFLSLSFFNGNEVDFLVIKNNNIFHIFDAKEVVEILSKEILVDTSKKRREGEFDDQKVVFKVFQTNRQVTIGEIEMRNDSEVHYREVKFWISKPICYKLLIDNIPNKKECDNKICIFGKAIKKFLKRKNIN